MFATELLWFKRLMVAVVVILLMSQVLWSLWFKVMGR